MRRDTLLDFFDDLSHARGEFLVHDDGFRSRSFTYAQVAGAARGFAAQLATAGVGKGDKVVFFSENRPEWIVAFWGCLLGGVVVVPIDYRSSPDFLARVARIVSPRLVLVGQDVPPVGDGIGAPIWRLSDWQWKTGEPPPVAIQRDDVAEIIFTSGATAEPKGVVITHRNVLANIVPVEREVLNRKWATPFAPIRFLNLLPLSHMFGQAMATFIPPMLPAWWSSCAATTGRDHRSNQAAARLGADLGPEDPRRPARARPAERVGGRDPPAAPTGSAAIRILKRWWRHRQTHRLFGWKFWAFIVGAAPLDAELEAFWGERGFAVIQGYGLTETAPIVTLNHPFGTKRGSVGKAIAGVEIKIAEDGEILVRGDNVTTGYFNAAEETARAFEDGWFHTGDIGELAPDGQVFIRGRKKEMIVTAEGLNVFPEDVERVLNELPGVRDSAVVGLAAGGSDERVHAVLVVDPGVDPDAVVRAANAVLADHQKIRRALIWPEHELPRTEGTRKLKRAAIRDWARSGGMPIGTSAGADVLAALVAKYAGREQVAATATIEELGLSSLERVELMVALEDKFQTRIDEGAFAEAKSVAELRSLVEKGASGEAARVEPVDFPSWNRSWPPARFAASACRHGSAAGARVRLDTRGRTREPRPHRWPGDLRRQPSKPHGRAGDPRQPAGTAAIPARAGDGQGILQGTFLSGTVRTLRLVHQQPQLLPVGALLQRISIAAARSGRAADPPLYRRDARRRLLRADFSGGKRTDSGAIGPIPPGHRNDCVQARRARDSGPPRGAGQGPAPHVEDGEARARAGRVRRPAAADRRGLRGAGQARRGRGQDALARPTPAMAGADTRQTSDFGFGPLCGTIFVWPSTVLHTEGPELQGKER